MLTAAASSHALKTAPQRSPSGRFRNSKTPWPWRTNESENPTQKLSNVTSETLETEQKTCKKLAAAAATAQRHSHTALPDGETPWPWSPRIPPKNSLTSRLKPRNKTENLQTKQKTCTKLAAAAATATAQKHSHTALPDGEAPWPGTTSKNMLPRGLTSLLWGRNVPSEILY